MEWRNCYFCRSQYKNNFQKKSYLHICIYTCTFMYMNEIYIFEIFWQLTWKMVGLGDQITPICCWDQPRHTKLRCKKRNSKAFIPETGFSGWKCCAIENQVSICSLWRQLRQVLYWIGFVLDLYWICIGFVLHLYWHIWQGEDCCFGQQLVWWSPSLPSLIVYLHFCISVFLFVYFCISAFPFLFICVFVYFGIVLGNRWWGRVVSLTVINVCLYKSSRPTNQWGGSFLGRIVKGLLFLNHNENWQQRHFFRPLPREHI